MLRVKGQSRAVATVKPVFSSLLKIDKIKVLMENGSLMKVKSIAECILQYFDLHKAIIGVEKQFLVLVLSGHLRQVLLYMEHQGVT